MALDVRLQATGALMGVTLENDAKLSVTRAARNDLVALRDAAVGGAAARTASPAAAAGASTSPIETKRSIVRICLLVSIADTLWTRNEAARRRTRLVHTRAAAGGDPRRRAGVLSSPSSPLPPSFAFSAAFRRRSTSRPPPRAARGHRREAPLLPGRLCSLSRTDSWDAADSRPFFLWRSRLRARRRRVRPHRRTTAEKMPSVPAFPRVNAWNEAPMEKKEPAIIWDFFAPKTRVRRPSIPLVHSPY